MKFIILQALFAELDGGSEYTSALTNFVDQTINEDTYTPGGMVYLDQWGAMRHAMNVAFIAHRVRGTIIISLHDKKCCLHLV